jgi:DNA-binding IclR family transcriptional regulator
MAYVKKVSSLLVLELVTELTFHSWPTGGPVARKIGQPRIGADEDASTNDRIMIQAVLKALAVLSLYDTLRPGWTVDQMAEEAGLTRMAVYRIVKTLESVGYLVGDPSTSLYHIGPALLAITHINAGWAADIRKAAQPYLKDLASQTGETVTLAIEKDGVAIEMDQVETDRPFRRQWAPGRIIGYTSTSHGKVFAAFKSSGRRQKILGPPRYVSTANGAAGPESLASELDRVRRDGVAWGLEEWSPGICAVAAPVRDQVGCVVASIAVLAPPGRFGAEERMLHAEAVKAAAAALSAFLGYLDSGQNSEVAERVE